MAPCAHPNRRNRSSPAAADPCESSRTPDAARLRPNPGASRACRPSRVLRSLEREFENNETSRTEVG
jgi:hypothetical protein